AVRGGLVVDLVARRPRALRPGTDAVVAHAGGVDHGDPRSARPRRELLQMLVAAGPRLAKRDRRLVFLTEKSVPDAGFGLAVDCHRFPPAVGCGALLRCPHHRTRAVYLARRRGLEKSFVRLYSEELCRGKHRDPSEISRPRRVTPM